jgi:dCTP diphosphatase
MTNPHNSSGAASSDKQLDAHAEANTSESSHGTPRAELGSKADVASDLSELREVVRDFVAQRDWQQFHSPKNLSMALIAECAEVIEHFQWLTPQASRDLDEQRRVAVSHELADVFVYTLMLADALDIDLLAAAHQKMALNAEKYPAEKVRGDARRANEYT